MITAEQKEQLAVRLKASKAFLILAADETGQFTVSADGTATELAAMISTACQMQPTLADAIRHGFEVQQKYGTAEAALAAQDNEDDAPAEAGIAAGCDGAEQ